MGDEDGGISSAAQSAQHSDQFETGSNRQRGLLGWLLGTRNLSDGGVGADFGPENPAKGAAAPGGSLGLLNLRSMRLDDVAIPKAEVIAVPDDIKKDDLVQVFRESGLTRLPVYTDTLDTPIGLIHLKDFALEHGFNGNGSRYNLKKLVRPLLYAPPSMPIGIMLQKMQADRIHMALVIDEYGGVDGLVTLEDLIEQVIGEIEDEHDVEEDKFWIVEKPGCYLAQAKAPLDEFEAEIGMRLISPDDEEEVDTLGGLVFMLTGRIPVRGEMVPHPAGPEFEIVDADPRRIKRLRVRVPGASEDA